MTGTMVVAALAMAVGTALGVVLGLVWAAACKNAERRRKRKNRERPDNMEREARRMETTKVVIWVCLLMGFAWVWCSYYLAYTDHEQIAESLSQVAVTEVIGVVLAYCIKSAVENLSKNNRWPDKGEPAELDGNGEDQAAG